MNKYFFGIDKPLLFSCIALSLLGLLTISSAQFVNTTHPSNTYVYKQLMWLILSSGAYLTILFIGNQRIEDYSKALYIALIALLVMLLLQFPSSSIVPEINGAKRWFIIGPMSFQPTEFIRIIIVFMIAKIIATHNHEQKSKFSDLTLLKKIGLVIALPFALIFFQPDTSSILIISFSIFMMIILSGINIKYIYYAIGIILGAALIFYLIIMYNPNLLGNIIGAYRVERIQGWIWPFQFTNQSLQLRQSLISIGSGGLSGLGYLNTTTYFPESQTDFIFTIFATEYGFIGVITALGLSLTAISRMIMISMQAPRNIDKYIVIGLTSIFTFQIIWNMGMVIGILPISGIPFPFMSYGGSGMLSFGIILGVITNINKTTKMFNT